MCPSNNPLYNTGWGFFIILLRCVLGSDGHWAGGSRVFIRLSPPTAVLPTSINTTQLSSGQHRNTAATQPSLYSDAKNDNSSGVDEAGRVDDPLELPGSVAPLPHLVNNMQECRIHTLGARSCN